MPFMAKNSFYTNMRCIAWDFKKFIKLRKSQEGRLHHFGHDLFKHLAIDLGAKKPHALCNWSHYGAEVTNASY